MCKKITNWLKPNGKKLLYFIIIYLFINTCGVWMPLFIVDGYENSIILGLITVSVSSTVSSSSEYILKKLKIGKDDGWEGIVNLVSIIISFALCVIICSLYSNHHTTGALILSIISFILSCCLWWYQNRDNNTYTLNVYDTLE